MEALTRAASAYHLVSPLQIASGYNPNMSKAQTLGELQNRQPRGVRDEIRDNLIWKMSSGEELFPGIVGYGDTVMA